MEVKTPDPGALSVLSTAPGKKIGMAWARKLIKDADKPKGFSVVSAKRAMQLIVKQGKEPAAFKVAPDGSFTIELLQVGKTNPSPDINPWDEVVSDGQA